MATRKPVPAVHVLPEGSDSATAQWLIEAIEVGRGRSGVRLKLSARRMDGANAHGEFVLPLTAQGTRQWLDIVAGQCRKAEWRADIFPNWVLDAKKRQPRKG
jgi:hypothetical protein